MTKNEKILFPYDLSENASKILPYVLSMSEAYNSTICLLHVVQDLGRWGKVNIPHTSMVVDCLNRHPRPFARVLKFAQYTPPSSKTPCIRYL